MVKSVIIHILDKYPKIALAVSGGSDSMAMCEWFRQNRPKDSFLILNIDHHIRGKESADDSSFVKAYAERYGLEYLHYDIDVLEYSREHGKGIEQSARELRHDIYRKVCQESAYVVATAHHQSDQVESVMLHIARGTGINGLSGMNVEDGYLIRPLLYTTKQEINDFIATNHLEYREDSTNNDIAYSRNYMRIEVIPNLEKRFDGFMNNIVKLAKRAREIQDFIDTQVPIMSVEQGAVKCDIRDKHRVVASEMLRRAFCLLGVEADVEERHIELLLKLVDKPNGTRLDMPYNTIAYSEKGNVVLEKEQPDMSSIEYPFGEGIFEFGDIELLVQKVDEIAKDESLYMSGDNIINAVIRTRRKGDYIEKFGGGTKSLGDYLTDKKVPIRLRDRLPLIAEDSCVLCMTNVDISSSVKVTNDTKAIYKITILNN